MKFHATNTHESYKLLSSSSQSEHQKSSCSSLITNALTCSKIRFLRKICLLCRVDGFLVEVRETLWGKPSFLSSSFGLGPVKALWHRQLIYSSPQIWEVGNTLLMCIDGEMENQRKACNLLKVTRLEVPPAGSPTRASRQQSYQLSTHLLPILSQSHFISLFKTFWFLKESCGWHGFENRLTSADRHLHSFWIE